VVQVGPGIQPQELANTVWAYGTRGWKPGVKARAALRAAVVRVGPDLKPQREGIGARDRAAGSVAHGGAGGHGAAPASAAAARAAAGCGGGGGSGSGSGSGRGGGGTGGVRAGASPAAIMHGRISQEDDPERLLCLDVGDELDSFGVGGGKGRNIALNRLISQEDDPERLLRLLGVELEDLNDVNVATAFSKLGKLCDSGQGGY